MTETPASYAHVVVNHDGRPGASESLGMPATVAEAKDIGERYALAHGADPGTLHWKQTSERSWILMAGGIWTRIYVAWAVPQEKAS